jgi:hypothetical protein
MRVNKRYNKHNSFKTELEDKKFVATNKYKI